MESEAAERRIPCCHEFDAAGEEGHLHQPRATASQALRRRLRMPARSRKASEGLRAVVIWPSGRSRLSGQLPRATRRRTAVNRDCCRSQASPGRIPDKAESGARRYEVLDQQIMHSWESPKLFIAGMCSRRHSNSRRRAGLRYKDRIKARPPNTHWFLYLPYAGR